MLALYGGFKWRNIKRLKRNVFFIASAKSYFSDGISHTHISVEVDLDNQAIGQFFKMCWTIKMDKMGLNLVLKNE